jgi:hypothetical protein
LSCIMSTSCWGTPGSQSGWRRRANRMSHSTRFETNSRQKIVCPDLLFSATFFGAEATILTRGADDPHTQSQPQMPASQLNHRANHSCQRRVRSKQRPRLTCRPCGPHLDIRWRTHPYLAHRRAPVPSPPPQCLDTNQKVQSWNLISSCEAKKSQIDSERNKWSICSPLKVKWPNLAVPTGAHPPQANHPRTPTYSSPPPRHSFKPCGKLTRQPPP